MPLHTIRPFRVSFPALALAAVLLILLPLGESLAEPPAIPLANVYDKGVHLADYWVSEKLDGVRAYWDGQQLWSRGGHVYHAPTWFTRGFPSHPLDGELWAGRGRFAFLSGVVRKHEPVEAEWRQVHFHVFDLPVPGLPFDERYQRLEALVSASGASYLRLVRQAPVGSHKELMARMERIVADGGEGLMLKRIRSLYQSGRSDDLLKVKPFQDAEGRVIGYVPGEGRLQGMMGSLRVRLADGRELRIGTGFTDAQRRHPPPVGSTITFRYRGYTTTGLPRFASFLRIRDDEPKD